MSRVIIGEHDERNLKLKMNSQTIPIHSVFHNLRGYDSHLMKQAISKTNGGLTCIPNKMEKYMSFSLTKTIHYTDKDGKAGKKTK